jgi:hypothetical protein
MRDVLNRDLENRANDIAATPENIATSDLEHTYCDNPACECNKGYPVHGSTSSVEKYNAHMKLWENAPTGCGHSNCQIHYPGNKPDYSLPNASDHCGNEACCGPEETEVPAKEWPIDPETGTPVVETEGEVKDLPEPVDASVGPRPPVTQYPMQKNKWTADPAVNADDGPLPDAIPGQAIVDHVMGLDPDEDPEHPKWARQVDGPLHCDAETGTVVLGCPGCGVCMKSGE